MELAASAPTTVAATCTLLDVDEPVAAATARWRLPAGPSRRALRVRLPPAERRGYGLRLELGWAGGRATASEAVEALAGWWESPRHVALTRFDTPDSTVRRVAALHDWHVTVAQAYDWMYRHYRYEPPVDEPFRDALGRRVSHAAVRAAVRAGHRAGIATLAYGAVYGAEPEYIDAHPDERVFDAGGAPHSLGGTFFITDLRPGRPWRRRLLAEYARACRRFGFDGIHMDTYGPPHEAAAADGERIEFAALYPGLIAEAAERVAATRSGARVLFNCVEGFPLAAVARSATPAIYLELWPPDVTYADIARWIQDARALGEGRPVVVAAYLGAFRAAASVPSARAAAFEAAVLLTTVVTVVGGYHHVLAEGDRLLVEGYYPAALPLRSREARELQAAWRFGARYLHLLSERKLAGEPLEGIELYDHAGSRLPIAAEPAAGRVWVRHVRRPGGRRVLHIVDLRDQPDDRWDAPRRRSPSVARWRLVWPGTGALVAMSPWTADGSPVRLRPAAAARSRGEGGSCGGTRAAPAWCLPPFRRWLSVGER